MDKEVVEKGLREVDNEVDKKINFLGRKHGRGDDAWSKAGAVTSGDYSRPQLKHYHKCAPGLGRSVSENRPPPSLPDRPHHQQQLLCHHPPLALELGGKLKSLMDTLMTT